MSGHAHTKGLTSEDGSPFVIFIMFMAETSVVTFIYSAVSRYQFSPSSSKCALAWLQAGQQSRASVPSWR